MKMTKRFLSIMLSILLILSVLPMASAPAFAAEKTKSQDGNWGIYADYNKNTCIIYGYYGSDANLKIPSKIDGLKVTKIQLSTGGSPWTNNYTNRQAIVTIEVPDTITELGYASFANLPNLKAVSIPSSVKTFGASLFAWSTSLEEFTIPKNMKEIPNGMFSSCTSLKNVTIHSGVTALGEGAFAGCISLKTIKLPSKLKTIGERCFGTSSADWCGLESISIPNSVTSIGCYAFNLCKNLTEVKMSTRIEEIGSNAFSECENLKSITIPSSCKKIEYGVFDDCDSLTTAVFRSDLKLPSYSSPLHASSLLTVYSASSEKAVREYCSEKGIRWKSLNPPKLTSKKRTATTATLKWSSVSGAVGYKVYMKTGTGSYKLMKTTTDLSYKATGLKKGVTYRFYVTTLKEDDLGQNIESKGSSVYKTYLK
ncbi:MAG: leucine-rich repeat protein [Anaerovoracaceae bacterium]